MGSFHTHRRFRPPLLSAPWLPFPFHLVFNHRPLLLKYKENPLGGQNGCYSCLERSHLVLELGRFSEDKIKMLDYREKRLQMEPLKFSSASLSTEELDSLEFRKVVCEGVYDEEKSIFVGPRSRSISGVTENGYYLITPPMPVPNCPDGESFPVTVNRGWVPRRWKDKFVEASRHSKQSLESLPSPSQAVGTKSRWRFWSKNLISLRIISLLSHL